MRFDKLNGMFSAYIFPCTVSPYIVNFSNAKTKIRIFNVVFTFFTCKMIFVVA